MSHANLAPQAVPERDIGCFGALTLPELVAQVSDVVENFPKTQAKLAETLEG